MAKKRMFSEKIVESDAFLDMPLTSQALYFHLGMEADDDGFVGNAKRIQRAIGAADDDMNILVAKRFILRHNSGIVIIKHWRINNTIRKDRYTETMYGDIKDLLVVKENGAYTEKTKCLPNDNRMSTNGMSSGIPNGNHWLQQEAFETVRDEPERFGNTGPRRLATNGIPNGNQTVPQVRLGKDRLGKDRVAAATRDVSDMDTTCIQNGSNMDTDCIQGVSTDNGNPDGLADKATAAVFSTFEECGFAINQHASSRLIGLINDYSAKWVTEAIKRAADRGRKNLGYVEGILSSWKQKGAMDDGRREGSGTASRASSRTDERIGGTIV